jgi:hypothetical protein
MDKSITSIAQEPLAMDDPQYSSLPLLALCSLTSGLSEACRSAGQKWTSQENLFFL